MHSLNLANELSFSFDASNFVQTGFEFVDGDWSPAPLHQLKTLKELHPELNSWGLLPLGMAFGDYSQDIFAVNWAEWIVDRDNGFLAYIYVRQKATWFHFDSMGFLANEIHELGKVEPWKKSSNLLPKWVK